MFLLFQYIFFFSGKMMKNIVILIILCSAALCSNGQSFLTKYPKLTKKNMPAFFADWKTYSDSINASNIIADSVLDDVIKQETALCGIEECDNNIIPIFKILPRYIMVMRYYLEIDTVMARICLGSPVFNSDLRADQFEIDSITPILPHDGLYLTTDIYKVLSKFVGGVRSGNKISRIKKGNVNKIKKYIPVDYGHWGGYWWFTSFPTITNIFYANNLIAVIRRTSWWTGDEIWYINTNGKFIRCSEPVSSWVE